MRRNIFWLFILAMLVGCAPSVSIPNLPVRDDIKNIYHSSVSILMGPDKVVGSGTIIKNRAGERMLVITAAHVIKAIQDKNLPIFLSLSYEKPVKLMVLKKIDYTLDLALLEGFQIEKMNGPYVELSNNKPKIGDKIFVIGAPSGDSRTVTNGIISNFEDMDGKHLYRISAPIFFGSSGGGVFDDSGKLIGVAHALQMIGGFIIVPGAGFCISLEDINKFKAQK